MPDDSVLSKLLGKKVKINFKQGSVPPFRIGILEAFDGRDYLLNDNGRLSSIPRSSETWIEEVSK